MRDSLLSLVIAISLVMGCSSADEHPLGGPYGGTTNATAPSVGASSNAGPNDDDGDPASDGDTDAGSGGGVKDSGKPGTGGGNAGDSGTSHGGNSAPDAGTDPGNGGTPAPTWTAIVNGYLKSGTVGNCGASGCHGQMNAPASAYAWLTKKRCAGKTLVDRQQSCLTWYGGNMPPHGASSAAQAQKDLEAWAAAGAPND